MDIKRFDLSILFAPYEAEGLSLAQVIAVHRDRWELAITIGDRAPGLPVLATLTGRLRGNALKPVDMPVVGDWVAVEVETSSSSVPHESAARIAAVLPRRTLLAR
jgi:putative ribosome biogenesis GTPase RsgA